MKLFYLFFCFISLQAFAVSPEEMKLIRQKQGPLLEAKLTSLNLKMGSPVFIRVFKTEDPDIFPSLQPLTDIRGKSADNHRSGILEIWMKKEESYILFQRYAICAFSGKLGPKKKEGDKQTPEGFYTISYFKENSDFYLALQVSYPNAYDLYRKYTGSSIMVHGDCDSVGCMAMGLLDSLDNSNIEEIYLLTEAAKGKGHTTPIHIFPFPLTDSLLKPFSTHPAYAFWLELQAGYEAFERNRIPPQISVVKGQYQIR